MADRDEALLSPRLSNVCKAGGGTIWCRDNAPNRALSVLVEQPSLPTPAARLGLHREVERGEALLFCLVCAERLFNTQAQHSTVQQKEASEWA